MLGWLIRGIYFSINPVFYVPPLLFSVLPLAHAENRVLWLTVNSQHNAEINHSLTFVRAKQALAKARHYYTDSRFTDCSKLLLDAETQLRYFLRSPEDWHIIKQLNQWIGLCYLSEGDRQSGVAAFGRAVKLPGPLPDPAIFPPPVMKEYQACSTSTLRHRCQLKALKGNAEIYLSGKLTRTGSDVEFGETYLAWRINGEWFSDRVMIDEKCRLPVPEKRLAGAQLTISTDEAKNSSFLFQLGKVSDSKQIVLFYGADDDLQLRRFNVSQGRFIDPTNALPFKASNLLSSPQPAVDLKAEVEKNPQDSSHAWYKRWWVWTLVGTAVAAAITVPIILNSGTQYDLIF